MLVSDDPKIKQINKMHYVGHLRNHEDIRLSINLPMSQNIDKSLTSPESSQKVESESMNCTPSHNEESEAKTES